MQEIVKQQGLAVETGGRFDKKNYMVVCCMFEEHRLLQAQKTKGSFDNI